MVFDAAGMVIVISVSGVNEVQATIASLLVKSSRRYLALAGANTAPLILTGRTVITALDNSFTLNSLHP